MPENCPDEPGGIDGTTLANIGTGLARVKKENEEIEERSVSELIKLDQYLKGRKAQCTNAGDAWGAVSKVRAVPPDGAGTQ